MKNKGFTLLELLGVIIILAILVTLVFPSVINFIKSSTAKKDKIINDLIISAAESYINDNDDEYSKIYGNAYCISLEKLVGLNYLKNNIIEDIDTQTVKVFYKGSFEYEIVNNNSCNEIAVVLEPNLIPVKYNGDNWIIADVTKEEWFNYDKQEWANVIILNSDINKNIGDIVTVDGDNPDALAMFVWIPRYSYTIGNTYGVQLSGGSTPSQLTPGAIDIRFVSKETKEKGSASYTGNSPSNWLTHPAFTFGTEELPGMWVGKFETSHVTLSSSSAENSLGCSDENCENSDGLRILPNVQSLRYNDVSNFFFASRSMSRSGNVFKINSNNLDSHMMKNSEWGVVAYFTQSKYGKYGNDDYSGANKDVYQNKSSEYKTGNSNGTPSQSTSNSQCSYDDLTNRDNGNGSCGGGASTTGNITGIYDMSGGSCEYVMSAIVASDGNFYTGRNDGYNSGFEGKLTNGNYISGSVWPEYKYYNLYKEIYINILEDGSGDIDFTVACNDSFCYGQVLPEINGWYGTYQGAIGKHDYPKKGSVGMLAWFIYGGNYDFESAGIFSLVPTHGDRQDTYSSRVVLTPVKNN